ncbi:hypothetical protein KAH37_10560 [bacterium]|nr:hypothetical protein [bacterium]
MKKTLILLLLLSAFVFVACGDTPLVQKGDVDTTQPDDGGQSDDVNDDVAQDEDKVEKEDKTETQDSDDAVKPIEPTACTMDEDCKDQAKTAICVAAKCKAGCKSDDGCPLRLRCNLALGRCLNLAASSQACSTRNCAAGCCVAKDGLTLLECAKTPTPGVCGVCKQGEVFLDGNKCIEAACDVNDDECPTLNAGKEDEECYKCKAGALICEMDEAECSGSAAVTVTAYQCLSAGQQCRAGVDECCSGQPCVNGYCY